LDSGHINPLTEFELRTICSAENLDVIALGSMCRIPKFWLSKNLRYTFYSILNLVFGWVFGKNSNGDILYLVARRTR
jgi:hypothetical protein